MGSGRTLTGQTVEAFWNSVAHAPLLCVGINCALGPEGDAAATSRSCRGWRRCYVSCYPNAGLPNPLLPTGFAETPEHMAPMLREWAETGWLNIVGGCCGTTPDAHPGHRRGRARPAAAHAAAVEPHLRLSGLEPLTIRPDTNFVNVGERTNVTGSPKFAKLILDGKYEEAWPSRASRSRTARRSSTSTWTRACWTPRPR